MTHKRISWNRDDICSYASHGEHRANVYREGYRWRYMLFDARGQRVLTARSPSEDDAMGRAEWFLRRFEEQPA